MNVMEEVQKLRDTVEATFTDAQKAPNNHAARVRLRKAMMEIRETAQAIRAAILTLDPERDVYNAVRQVGKQVGGPSETGPDKEEE